MSIGGLDLRAERAQARAAGVQGTAAGEESRAGQAQGQSVPGATEVRLGDEGSDSENLRILFFVGKPGILRRYPTLVPELVARGHEVHLAFAQEPRQPIEELAGASTRVGFDRAPDRATTDGWRSIAWLVRALADLARYADARYDGAPRLRQRMATKVVGKLEQPEEFEPFARRVGLRVARRLVERREAAFAARVIRLAGRFEEAIPTSKRIDRYVREHAPDVVLVSGAVKYGSPQIEYLKSARALGIPSASCVASWDNLTNKGLLKLVPERVFVWNDVQRREAVELHGAPPERVVATGAHLFDRWFERRPSRSREEFARQVGFDPGRPYVLYVCSSPFVVDYSDREVGFVQSWLEAMRASDDERVRQVGAVVRPHPAVKKWIGVDLERLGAVVWPAKGVRPVTEEEQAGFYDSLAYSAAVVGVNTTAMIEAAILGKSVLTVLEPEFGQESTLHFQYLLAENGGFLHVAASLEEHVHQLSRVLEEDGGDADQRRRFLASFVRPAGLEQPATAILADAVEDLAALELEAPARRVLARRSILALVGGIPRRRVRRLRRRIVGKLSRYRSAARQPGAS